MTRRTSIAERADFDGIDAIAAESGENTLVFKSKPRTPPSLAWRAEIVLPPVDTLDAPLEVRVSDGSGKPASDGTFAICGVNVAIAHGRGTIIRKALVAGLATGGVSFAANGGFSVSGTPVFGSLE